MAVPLALVALAGPSPAAAAPAPAPAALAPQPGTWLVSRGDAPSTGPSISPDGTFVAFTSAAPLRAGDGNGVTDVYLAAVGTGTPFAGTPVRVSLADDGTDPDGPSSDPSVSADGHWVAFTSEATNLVPGDTNGVADVFLRDVRLGRTYRVQAGAAEPRREGCAAGGTETGATTQPAISANGEVVVFTSGASTLVAGDDNCRRDVFRLDRETGTVTRLSTHAPAYDPAVSGDGLAAAFTTGEGADTRGWHWTADRLVPLGRDQAGDRTGQASLSGDGVVAYVSDQPSHHGRPLPPGPKVFVEWPGGHWEWVSDGLPAGTPVSAPALSADGSTVAFVAGGQVRVASTEGRYGAGSQAGSDGVPAPATGPAGSSVPSVSATGRSIALVTTTPLAGDGAADQDVAVVGLAGKDLQLHPALDTFAGPAKPRPLAYVDPARIPANATTGGSVTSAGHGAIGHGAIGHGAIGHGAIGHGAIGHGAIGHGAIGLGVLGHGAIGHGAIGHGAIGHGAIGHGAIGHGAIALGLAGHGAIGHGAIGDVSLARLSLDSRTPGLEDGWAGILRGTPFEEVPLEAITFAELADWTRETLAAGAGAPEAHRLAAQRIEDLGLADFSPDSVLGELAVGSLLMLGEPVAGIPLAGPGATPLANWQAAVAAQGFDPGLVDATTLVVDLDRLGVDLVKAGLGLVELNDVATARTLAPHLVLRELTLDTPLGLTPLASLPPAVADAVVDCTAYDCTSGTLRAAAAAGAMRATATLATVAGSVSDLISLEEVVRTLVRPHLYPWEQVQWQAIGAGRYAIPKDDPATEGPGHSEALAFRAGFDTGPGGATYVQGAVLEALLPPGTAFHSATVTATGPLEFQTPFSSTDGADGAGTAEGGTAIHDLGRVVRLDLGDVPSGTSVTVRIRVTDAVDYAQGAPLTSVLRSAGGQQDEATITLIDGPGRAQQVDPDAGDSPATAPLLDRENRVYFGGLHDGDDVDYVWIRDPGDDVRLIVALAGGGDADLGIFRATSPSAADHEERGLDGASLLLEDERAGGTQQPAPLNILDEPGHDLLDGSTHSGPGDEVVATTGGHGRLLVRVASADGRASTLPYTLRWITVKEEPEQTCPATPMAETSVLDRGVAPPLLLPGTNTVFLVDQERFTARFGTLPDPDDLLGLPITAGQFVVNQLQDLDGQLGIRSAVIPITGTSLPGSPSTQPVRDARSAYLANPCSVDRANAFAGAVRDLLRGYLDASLGVTLKNVVLVGGDDMIPFHRVPGATVDIREEFNESALRLRASRGTTCAVTPAPGTTCDGRATPLSAAAAGDYVVTDDPYGDPRAARVLDRDLWVPEVAVGRLVETPRDVRDAVKTFLARGGVIRADATTAGTPRTSALATGYAAWGELPAAIQSGLRKLVTDPDENDVLTGGWTKAQLEAALGFDSETGRAPTLLSINAHSSETALLPGDADAAGHEVTADDLWGTRDLPPDVDARLDGRLLFTVGCHAGGTLPDSWYGGEVKDFAQVFGNVGGYIGNTGYGIADTAALALSERLMADYADLLGRSVGGEQLTAGQALALAKQRYLDQLGTYLGYDEKVVMQATYYGLPMWRLPAPAGGPVGLEQARSTWEAGSDAGLVTRSHAFDPDFDTVTGPDGAFLTVRGQAPQASPGNPILPRLTEPLPSVSGAVPHGALVTALTSHADGPTRPAIAGSSYGVEPGIDRRDDLGFPTSIAHVTGHRLSLLAGRVSGESTGVGTTGVTERFSHLGVTTYYSDSSDHERPVLRTTTERSAAGLTFRVVARDEGGGTVRAVVLYQPLGATEWRLVELARVPGEPGEPGDTWEATVPDPGDYRALGEAVDLAGNVGIDTRRGHFHVGTDAKPQFAGGGDETIVVHERLVRDEVVTDADSSRFTATADWGYGVQELEVRQGPDGVHRLHLDILGHTPGTFTVTVTVCDDSGQCTTRTFQLVVLPANSPPDARVTLSTTRALTDEVLRATVETSDPDDDPVSVTYRWFVDERLVEGADGPTLDLGRPGHGDDGQTVTVTVVPHDGFVDGLQSSASAVVVRNSAPEVTLAPGSGAEGAAYTLTGSVTDAEGHALQPGTVDWGDGSPAQQVSADSSGSFSAMHTYADDGAYVVTVSYADAHGARGQATTTVAIANVAPTILPVTPPDPVPLGEPVTVAFAFTDPGADTHVATVDWGDGSSSPASVDQAARTGTATHTYATAGTYVVTLTVTDDDGGQAVESLFGVVFVPGNGVVTANGTYTSPRGAWPAQPGASGQAEFGANVSYTSGGGSPTGKLRFTYDIQPTDKGCMPASCLELDATRFTSLVVTGPKAVLKGTGTLNGVTGHTFVFAVLDGQPDRVRVRILNAKKQVVYDSQPGAADSADPAIPLDGGSVLVK